jgi:integrase
VRGGRRDAEKELRRRLVAVDRGEASEPTKLTVGGWLDQWLAIVKPEIAAATFDHYQRNVTRLKPHLGGAPLAKLSHAQVQQLFSTLAQGGRADGKPGALAPSSRKQIYAVLNIALNRAVDLQLIGSNPAHGMRRRMPRGDDAPEMAVLSPEESAGLLNAARGSALFSAVLLAMATGCRRGEAAALTWGDVDLDRGVVILMRAAKQIGGSAITIGKTKSGKPRTVTLGANAIEELRAWRLTQAEQLLRLGVRQGADTPVCTRADGSRIGPSAITTDFWRLARRLGLRVHYHSLRHGHATALLLAGVHPKVAQERLGHHSVAFTLDRYSHTIERLHDDAAAKIDGIFGVR